MIKKRLNSFRQAVPVSVLLLVCLLFARCAEEQVGAGVVAEHSTLTGTLRLSSRPLSSAGGATRAPGPGMDVDFGAASAYGTRSTDEEAVDNICVFQFEGGLSSGTAVLKRASYFSNLTGLQLDVPFVESSGFFVYVCANVGDITGLFTVDHSTFQSLTDALILITGQTDFGSLLPMCGASRMTYDTGSLSGDVPVSLSRLVAKISFTYDLTALPDGDSFTVTDISLKNVPREISYVTTSLLTTTTDLADYPGTVPDPAQAAYTNTWYMGPNLRGTGGTDGGNPVTSWTERIAANAPSGSAYIELKGNYVSGGITYVATYVLYLGNGTDQNDYNVIANHSYTVTAKIKGINTTDHRVTLNTDSNLSSDKTANCYIVSESNKDYSFDGTVRGNGRTTDYAKAQYPELGEGVMFPDILSGASDAVTIPRAEISDAYLVWQTATGLLDNVSWDASTGQVKFTTGSVLNGNAVIAVRDASHNILWSWHIWRTDGIGLEDMSGNGIPMQTNTVRSWIVNVSDLSDANKQRTLVMMDRNLGASGTDATGASGSGSLHYQFGRKDPFPGSGSVSANTEQNIYDASGTAFTVSSGAILFSTSSVGSTANDIIDYSIKNPERFIYCNAQPYNWINTATATTTADWKISNCLWGDNNTAGGGINSRYMDPAPWDGGKTIYDPCPAGWRVAPIDGWTGILNTSATGWTGQSVSGSVNTSGSWMYGWDFYTNGNTGTTTFCPASGYRGAGNGALNGVGSYGYGWLSSPGGGSSLNGGSLYFYSSNVYVAYENYRARGFPVRCVQE